MRLALALTILLLSGYTTGLAATDEMIFPFPPEAQACRDHFPSASKDPAAFLRCADILEVAAVERWQAMRIAKQPDTQACLMAPVRSRSCDALLDKEEAAVDRDRAFARLKKNEVILRIIAHAAERAARPRREYDASADIERLDADIARMERGMDMLLLPTMREPIRCTSYSLGMFTNTDCD